MLSKCANPGCTAVFLYLHQGKLFRLDVSSDLPSSSTLPKETKNGLRTEFFWLCTQCAAELTIDYARSTGVSVVPLAKPLARAASSSQM
jgi:hypothetical protein